MLDTGALACRADADAALLRVLPEYRTWRLPVVVLGEFLHGIRRWRERSMLERWVDEVKSICPLVAVDEPAADDHATIREEVRAEATPIPENDVWIAALRRQSSQELAGRDAHFDRGRGLRRATW